jgi:hypothetical protein
LQNCGFRPKRTGFVERIGSAFNALHNNFLFKFRIQKQLKRFLVRLRCMADGSQCQKKFLKVKIFSGLLDFLTSIEIEDTNLEYLILSNPNM